MQQQVLPVFIDTSIVLQEGFRFGSGSLASLQKRASIVGSIRVVLPATTVREIRQKIRDWIHDGKQAIGKAKKGARILRNLPSHPLLALFDDPDWGEIGALLEKQLDEYLSATNAEILDHAGDDILSVVEDHYEGKAPFGAQGKRHEFLDAFAVYALVRYARSKSCQVAVVSADNDMRRACERYPEELKHYESVAVLLENLLPTEILSPEEIKRLLKPHEEQLHKAVIASFEDRGFYWNTDLPNAEIEETYDCTIEKLELSIIDIDGQAALVEAEATIYFQATAVFDDPDTAIYDSETQTAHFWQRQRADLSADIVVPVSFVVQLEALQAGEQKLEDLSVNNDEDIWFSADAEEIENL